MPRTFKAFPRSKGNSRNQRIPLSLFKEPIVMLRAVAVPSPTDASWTRQAKKVFQGVSAVEQGVVKLIASEKQSDKELWLFVVHYQDGLTPALTDYIVWGSEVYHVQGYEHLGERGGYIQINARYWGLLEESDFILSESADVAPVHNPENRDNLFWDAVPSS